MLTTEEKKTLLIGSLVIGAVAGTVSYFRKRKPKLPTAPNRGIQVSAQCNTWTVTDRGRVQQAFTDVVLGQTQAGVHQAQAIATAVVRAFAPVCVSSVKPRNPGEALFRYLIWVDVAQELVRLRIFTETQKDAEVYKAKAWAVENGVDPNHPAILEGGGEGLLGAPSDITQTCDAPLVPIQVQPGVWECGCPEGLTMRLNEENGMMIPECV